MADKPLTHGNGVDSQEAGYRALHATREALERELLLVQQQQRFGDNATAVEQARQREASLLKDLDRVLTQIRAAEVRRKAGAKRW